MLDIFLNSLKFLAGKLMRKAEKGLVLERVPVSGHFSLKNKM